MVRESTAERTLRAAGAPHLRLIDDLPCIVPTLRYITLELLWLSVLPTLLVEIAK